ncbi:MAG: hypothetical protein K5853_02425, partial [Lachnospiraceae bacterium]|nr:hypothetical protein [Lachnospiraceae bacterium]
CKSINHLIILIRKGSLEGMFLSDFFFFCQSTATVLILRYCLMNTAVKTGIFSYFSSSIGGIMDSLFPLL